MAPSPQGGGKRRGAFAMYLEPWHADVFDFLQLKRNHGKEEARARDLFYALWLPDLFMKRVGERLSLTLASFSEPTPLVPRSIVALDSPHPPPCAQTCLPVCSPGL